MTNPFNVSGGTFERVLGGLGEGAGRVILQNKTGNLLQGLLENPMNVNQEDLAKLYSFNPQAAQVAATEIQRQKTEIGKRLGLYAQQVLSETDPDKRRIMLKQFAESERSPIIQKELIDSSNMDNEALENDLQMALTSYQSLIGLDKTNQGSVKIAQTATGYDLVDPKGKVIKSVRDLGEAEKLKLQLEKKQLELDKASQELKDSQDEKSREKESAGITLGSTAELFASTISDPEIESATGIEGVVKGTVGRLTGSRAGVLKGRLTRLGTNMVLQAVEALSGAMSDGDIKLLQSTMPASSDDVALWQDWYSNEYLPMVKAKATGAGIDFSSLGLPESLKSNSSQTVNPRLEELRKKHNL